VSRVQGSGCTSRVEIWSADDRMDHLNYFEDFCTENGSSQGQNLALTGLFVPSSLDSGRVEASWGHRRPFVGAFQGRSWSHGVVLGAFLWAFIVKNDKVS